MVVTFNTIPDIPASRVLFVSARLGNDPLLEFEKFDELELVEKHHLAEREIIYNTIVEMGQRGARPYDFRPEGPAFALPGRVDRNVIDANPRDFGLRLYCGFLRADLVLLLNGGIKTTQRNQDCPNVGPHFRIAERIVRALLVAEEDGFVRFTSNGIEMDDEFELKI